ncbi:MAG: Na/Pi cotransporter family protein [Candidatus Pacearchaeota archaeon]
MEFLVLLSILIGLVLFLFGIENFNTELQKINGESFRNFLRRSTDKRINAAIVGFLASALLNSSTAISLISLSLVNNGLISFSKSLPIFLGANVGSTITTQLIAFKFAKFAPLFLVFGFFLSFFNRYKIFGKIFFYFGMVFFGLGLISDAVSPISQEESVLTIFSSLKNPFLLIFLGVIFSAIVHSSALTIGIAIIFSSNNLLSLNQAIPLILGANLGTTFTSLIASIKMDLYAKRAAFSHFFFNFFGVLILFPFINSYAGFISSLGGSIENQIANAHTIFNLLIAIFFFFTLDYFVIFAKKVIKGDEEEILLQPKFINQINVKNKENSFELIEKEIAYYADIDKKLFSLSKSLIENSDEKKFIRLRKFSSLSNILAKSIGDSLFLLSQEKLDEKEAKKILYLIRLSNSLEQLGDLAEDLVYIPEKIRNEGYSFEKEEFLELKDLFNKVDNYLNIFEKNFSRDFIKVKIDEKEIRNLIDKKYFKNISSLKKENYPTGGLFVELCSVLENTLFKISEIFDLSNHYLKVKKGFV